MKKVVNVAVGVIYNVTGEVLISYRDAKQHQGDKWEFPGGKIEMNETPSQALIRELQEEVGITAISIEPLIKLTHDYGDKCVCLHVMSVHSFTGDAHGKEGQPIQWVPPACIKAEHFPAANKAIIDAINLPKVVVITDCNRAIPKNEMGIFRAPQLSHSAFIQASRMFISANPNAIKVLNTTVARWKELGVDQQVGLHLSSMEAKEYQSRPVGDEVLLGMSCHNINELMLAAKLQMNYVLLSPVLKTTSHPDAEGLGWLAFSKLAELACMPVYALGGLSRVDLAIAQKNGAQGVAGITLGQ